MIERFMANYRVFTKPGTRGKAILGPAAERAASRRTGRGVLVQPWRAAVARWDWHVREGGAILVSCDASPRLPAAAAAPILLPGSADEAILWPARSRVRVAADLGAQVVIMGEDGRDLVIKLDERGVELLRSWARPCTEFRVTMPPDGSIVLHPMSGHDAELWRSGLVGQIVQNFSHPDWMIRIKPDKL